MHSVWLLDWIRCFWKTFASFRRGFFSFVFCGHSQQFLAKQNEQKMAFLSIRLSFADKTLSMFFFCVTNWKKGEKNAGKFIEVSFCHCGFQLLTIGDHCDGNKRYSISKRDDQFTNNGNDDPSSLAVLAAVPNAVAGTWRSRWGPTGSDGLLA